jgi:hypothetical protein
MRFYKSGKEISEMWPNCPFDLRLESKAEIAIRVSGQVGDPQGNPLETPFFLPLATTQPLKGGAGRCVVGECFVTYSLVMPDGIEVTDMGASDTRCIPEGSIAVFEPPYTNGLRGETVPLRGIATLPGVEVALSQNSIQLGEDGAQTISGFSFSVPEGYKSGIQIEAKWVESGDEEPAICSANGNLGIPSYENRCNCCVPVLKPSYAIDLGTVSGVCGRTCVAPETLEWSAGCMWANDNTPCEGDENWVINVLLQCLGTGQWLLLVGIEYHGEPYQSIEAGYLGPTDPCKPTGTYTFDSCSESGQDCEGTCSGGMPGTIEVSEV